MWHIHLSCEWELVYSSISILATPTDFSYYEYYTETKEIYT